VGHLLQRNQRSRREGSKPIDEVGARVDWLRASCETVSKKPGNENGDGAARGVMMYTIDT
jgi:hypothetical protein